MEIEKIIRDRPASFASFEDVVACLKSNGATGTDALQQARLLVPELFQKSQREGAVTARVEFEKREPTKAVQDFELRIAGIMEREKVSRTVAMQRARRQHPEEFERYQSA